MDSAPPGHKLRRERALQIGGHGSVSCGYRLDGCRLPETMAALVAAPEAFDTPFSLRVRTSKADCRGASHGWLSGRPRVSRRGWDSDFQHRKINMRAVQAESLS